jgi:hypothetical protein
LKGIFLRRARRITLLALVSSLAITSTAAAGNGPLPWEGGVSVVSEFEGRAAGALSEAARRQVYVICATPEEWTQIGAAQGFDPNGVWGLVPFDGYGNPANFTAISPQSCFLASEWMYATDRRGQKWCVTGTRVEYQAETRTEYRTEYSTEYRTAYKMVWKRKKVKGKWRRVRVRVRYTVSQQVAHEVPYVVTVQVPYNVPVEAVCPDYVPKLFAWQTLIHEGTHLTGLRDEALTDCFAMQNLAWFAWRMGIDAAQAREIGQDYWSLYYQVSGPSNPEYYSSECRNGGSLDLRPESDDWPLMVSMGGARSATYADLTRRRMPLRTTSHE